MDQSQTCGVKRVLSKYGAYTHHVAALSEVSSVKSSDRAKLRGYHTKWIEVTYMYLTGCAVLVDLLTPCSVFSKVMQSYEVDILEEKVYTHHVAALSEVSSVKSSDRAKLRGYHTKWIEGKYLIGCAVFVDLLTPCSVFSKVMQSDEVDILAAVTNLLKTMKETNIEIQAS